MDSKYLLENEELITQSDNNELTLTTLRIRHQTSAFGKANVSSIMLEKISSVEIKYKSKLWFLIIGIITTPVIIGIILIILYYSSRKHCIVITSDAGTSINVETKWLKHDAILDFINKVEIAKNNRYLTLACK